MNSSKRIIGFLMLASIIGFYVGVNLVFFPAEFQAESNIILGTNASHFSETRAPGVVILSTSLIILIGVLRTKWQYTSLLLSAIFYLSYGVGRLLSLVLDGMPAEILFYAMIGELVIGIIALILLRKMKYEKIETH